jgi:hypothetical protein
MMTQVERESIEKLQAEYDRSYGAWKSLESAFDDEDYDEDYDDTLTRKYEEGYSDALAMVLALLKEEK